MPDTRKRRGPHPKDLACFGQEQVPVLRRAVEDLSWLRGRGYSPKAALKLVGDRHSLRDRQRKALQRCAASDEACLARKSRQVPVESISGEIVILDGYNVLLTLEAALSNGVLLLAQDGVLRDLAAMSAHYRRLSVTEPALRLLADALASLRCHEVYCLLDRPVSNSGRLKKLIEAVSAEFGSSWQVELSTRTDAELKASEHVVATADSAILDRCARWVNLARWLVETRVPQPWIVDLGHGASTP